MRRLGLFVVCISASIACNELAGIGVPTLESPGADAAAPPPVLDAAPFGGEDADANANGGKTPTEEDAGGALAADGGTGTDVGVVPLDATKDTNVPDTFTPPPPAGKPGFDAVVGGTYGKSASFTLIATIGESPGGNNVGKSPSFVLKGGVIAVTQPN